MQVELLEREKSALANEVQHMKLDFSAQLEFLKKEKSVLSDEVELMKLDFVELVSRNLSLKKELPDALNHLERLKRHLNETVTEKSKLEDRVRRAEEEV